MVVGNSGLLNATQSQTKKKILILISEGGGGHKAAGDSMKEILGKEYEIEIVNALSDMLRPIDGLSLLTFGRFTGEDLYNISLRKGYHKFIKLLFCHTGTYYMRGRRKRIQALFEKYLHKKGSSAPALVISTFPMINAGLISATRRFDIPLLIMPTDLDSETFLLGMDEIEIGNDEKVVVAMPYDDPDLQLKAVREGHLKAEHLHVTGFPVRPACLKKYRPEELAELRKKHGLKEGIPILTLIMGAEGGDALLPYAQELSRLSLESYGGSFQLNVCVGRNRKIAKAIKEWLLKQGGTAVYSSDAFTTVLSKDKVFVHIREFTKEVVEIMACSDLLITKAGSCSVNEAIYLGKRLLLDNTENSSARHIWWENFNVAFVKKHNLGDAFTSLDELHTKAVALLNQTSQSPSARGDFQLPSFKENLLALIHKML
ncbi:MAG: glycosyltransferase [Chlamydiales bacterium]